MSYYIHPDVLTLKTIADNRWKEPSLHSANSPRTKTPHDAQSLVRLVSNSSWAVQDPYSEPVTRFIKWYRKGQEMDFKSMDNEKLRDELQSYLADIDDLFFFGLLTRKVKGKSGTQKLVLLRVTSEAPKGNYCGAYKMEDEGPSIRIHRYDRQGIIRPFEKFLSTLVHESCHAYLDIFSDTRHSKHQEWVCDYGGHGEMFWVLFRFIMEKIRAYTRSERWERQMKDMEYECVDITKTKGRPGDWGTPARTVMGGFLSPGYA
ncbi:hypothetical protein F5B22DRAFT_652290 [Xylaria bambusicola]|uniref:uncharacterized protein n=1 Tax=Xylaria bambusicola TaxID=326684 RepID=UPI002008D90F|nr:uncharacterized protein F5B22DRAFT_652290 [Xylaria bambusicola]KAI0503212.1 hypothetical protein F5B22DRAFT_652290 [Xylaria bambusicola]